MSSPLLELLECFDGGLRLALGYPSRRSKARLALDQRAAPELSAICLLFAIAPLSVKEPRVKRGHGLYYSIQPSGGGSRSPTIAGWWRYAGHGSRYQLQVDAQPYLGARSTLLAGGVPAT
jgi:hypothetical protein